MLDADASVLRCATHLQYALVFCLFALYAYRLCFSPSTKEEGFTQTLPFVEKRDDEIYDSFYVEIYDKLYVPARGAAVLDQSMQKLPHFKKKGKYVIASNTGDLMQALHDRGCDDAYTVKKSVDSVAHMKKKYSDISECVQHCDIAVTMCFDNNSISYFVFTDLTIYRYHNWRIILENIKHWLTVRGLIIVQFVDPQRFSTVLPAAREFIDFEKYATERITANKIDFNSFTYENVYQFQFEEKRVVVTETFIDKTNHLVRKNEQTLYIPSVDDAVSEFRACGFAVKDKIADRSNGNVTYVFEKR
jgi:hypothetical protein